MINIIEFFCLMLMGCALSILPASARAGEATGRVAVAKVNGKVLFMDQLEPVPRLQMKRRKADTPEQEKIAQRRAIEQLIDVELLSQQARNFTVPGLDEKVTARITGLRHTRPALFTDKTEAQVRELLADEILMETYLQQKGVADPDISETDIRALYDKGREGFRAEEAVRLCHISIQLAPPAASGKKTVARQVLERARRQILAGKTFAAAAEEALQDPDGSQGELDFATRREMPEAIGEAAFSLAPGSVSEIIETPSGMHLVKVLERRPARLLPYEEVHDFLRKYLQENRRRQVYQELVKGLRQQADIEILLEPS
jgi:parvulin-like peptidyl-prolyl isomerase